MKLIDKVCTRQQAIELQSLTLWQPKDSEDWQAGDIYSVIIPLSGEERTFILGNNEDAPYEMYSPVKLYDSAELGHMLGAYNEPFLLKDWKWACGRSEDGHFDTEAQAKANTLIIVIKQGDLNVEFLNKLFIEKNPE